MNDKSQITYIKKLLSFAFFFLFEEEEAKPIPTYLFGQIE
jgi:hypothetical protein